MYHRNNITGFGIVMTLIDCIKLLCMKKLYHRFCQTLYKPELLTILIKNKAVH